MFYLQLGIIIESQNFFIEDNIILKFDIIKLLSGKSIILTIFGHALIKRYPS